MISVSELLMPSGDLSVWWVTSLDYTLLYFHCNFDDFSEKNMDCAIYAINRKESTSENGLLFYLLNKESLDKTQVAVKESETTLPSLVEIDPTVPAVTLRQLGYALLFVLMHRFSNFFFFTFLKSICGQ